MTVEHLNENYVFIFFLFTDNKNLTIPEISNWQTQIHWSHCLDIVGFEDYKCNCLMHVAENFHMKVNKPIQIHI